MLSPVGLADTAPGTFRSFGKFRAGAAARAIRRAFEIAASAGLVLLALPAAPAIALVVWMLDGGRAFSSRKRPGCAGRLPMDRAILFLKLVDQCFETGAPECGGAGSVIAPTYDTVTSSIERSLKRLAAVDPDCLLNLRMYYMRSTRQSETKDERLWSRLIVKTIDKAAVGGRAPKSLSR